MTDLRTDPDARRAYDREWKRRYRADPATKARLDEQRARREIDIAAVMAAIGVSIA
jgi:hypothetical protein